MKTNKLKLNEEKTEILICSTGSKINSLGIDHILIGNDNIQLSSSARNLGVYLDSELSMDMHINHLCKMCYLELRRLGQLRPYLDVNAMKSLASSFILSRLDYCNSLLAGLPDEQLKKLQRIQNNTARLVLKKRRLEHVTPLLKQLHWLPVKARIEYKLALLCFKGLRTACPSYLSDLIVPYAPQRSLRSSNSNLLSVPRAHMKRYGQRAFTFTGPSTWNSLPITLRNCTNLTTFKTHLKSHLFRKYFC